MTIHIDSKMIEEKNAMDIPAGTIEAYKVPESEELEILMCIRAAQALMHAHAGDCEKLVVVRLLQQLFSATHEPLSDAQSQSSLFLYEPDIILHIAELLQLYLGKGRKPGPAS